MEWLYPTNAARLLRAKSSGKSDLPVNLCRYLPVNEHVLSVFLWERTPPFVGEAGWCAVIA